METAKTIAIFLVLMFCWQAEGWVGIIKSSPGSKTGGCYTKEYNLGNMLSGETRPIPGICAEATCQGGQGYIDVTGCSVVAADPPCHVVEGDLSKPFPHCCSDVKCDRENEIV
ncbi:uncharacterized protein ssp7 [Tribolium castaneum]|uniref:Single domain-containing protein n=1 Tax=Tribolium castaneum TaxID=7070 RepID=D6WG82_TRICA|nr:PREDICTED: uncharacterized protein LOC103312298 [Tribolium castaneum]EFA00544.1 hypothetical protein TcasGA2_TC003410 [Tribolium castaneum]|eukprot:XP_008190831.1 PREDICTED: uncharacterized protein LOC103312298 [Tribolium castaneum]